MIHERRKALFWCERAGNNSESTKIRFFLVEKKFGTGTALFVLFKSLTVPLFLSARDFDRDEGSRVRKQIIARYRNFQCFLFPLR